MSIELVTFYFGKLLIQTFTLLKNYGQISGKEEDLKKFIFDYQNRERRFGDVK